MNPRATLRRYVCILAGLVLCVQFSGCSLFVMAGKFLIGDPVVESQFRRRTGVDLRKEQKEVVVVCSVPESLRQENASIDHDLVEAIVRRFRIRDIKTVPTKDVNQWISSIGGTWNTPGQIAQKFDADYIIHIDLNSITYHEENSSELFRGNCLGDVYVYEIRQPDSSASRDAFLVFQHEFQSVYPQLYPVSSDTTSLRTFQEKYITRISDELARLFYDFKSTDEVY